MRPIKLTFAGLRSYRQETVIDFAELDLFAVIGDTGAGKSTIIEALSLALYAKKSWSGGGANMVDMIADGLNTMRIELAFHAAGQDWTVTRARHRNTTTSVDKLLSSTGGTHRIDGARAVNDKVEELIGLNHEQFTRAVVMPQGRFDLLLRATGTERTKILSSILGLDDITRTRVAVESVRDEWKPKAASVAATRSTLPADPRGELERAVLLAGQAGDRLAQLTTAVTAGDLAAALIASADSASARLNEALAAVPAPPAEDTAAVIESFATRASDLLARHEAAELALNAATAKLDELDAEAEAVLEGFPARDGLVAARTQLEAIARSLGDDLDAVRDRGRVLDELVAVTPDGTIDPLLITCDKELLAAAMNARRAASDAAGAVQHAKRCWQALAGARSLVTNATRDLEAGRPSVIATQEAVDNSQAKLDSAKESLDRALASHQAALIAGAVFAAASGCTPGDTCPVCEQVIPPGFIAPSAPDQSVVEGELASARTAVTTAEAKLAQHVAELRRVSRRLDQLTDVHTNAGEAVGKAEAQAQEQGVNVSADDESNAVAALVEIAEQAHSEAERLDGVAREAAQALAAERATVAARIAAHEAEVAGVKADVIRAQARVAAHQRTIDELPVGWQPSRLDPEDVAAVITRIIEAIRRLDGLGKQRLAAVEACTAATTQKHVVQAALVSEVKNPAAHLVRSANVRAGRVRDVAAAGRHATGLANVTWDAASPDDVADRFTYEELLQVASIIRTETAAAEQVLGASREVLRDLEVLRGDEQERLDETLTKVGCATINDLRTTHGGAAVDAANTETAVAKAEAAVTEAAALDKILAVAEPFVANLDVLAHSLSDQFFVTHLVKAREAELLAEASRRLKAITNGRFGFVADFGVVNINSGEHRTPDTLSGGERFQAALALALALIEIASRGGGRLDAVFVDEGFGSLDSNALEVALDTLGKIAGGGKMVALISHLRPVAEYVDTVLHVTKDDTLGSRIDVLTPEARESLLADDVRSGLMA